MFQRYFKVSIEDWQEKENFVEYKISVFDGEREQIVLKRYKDFYELHESIKRAIMPGLPPDLPARHTFSHMIRGNDPEFIGNR
jgi:hypothetical protein